MVQSKAASVDAFMSTVELDRKPALERLRAICLEALSGWEEGMHWGMPGYGPAGEPPQFCFNNQRQYISLYPGAAAIDRFRERLTHASFGKGCVRFGNPQKIAFDAVADMLADLRARGRGGC